MNCDFIAPWYRWLEYAAFGGALRRRRTAFLGELPPMRNALLLGDGDGRFLESFAAFYPQTSIDVVELSAKMIELAQKRAPRARFHQADVRTSTLPESHYDVLVTHFFFDCFDQAELDALITKLSPATDCWLVSEFRRTPWSAPLLRVLYFFFRITTGLRTTHLADHHAALIRSGFRLDQSESALAGLLVSEIWLRDGRQ